MLQLKPTSVLVIGTGSIGRRHIQCLKELAVPEIYICEPIESNRKLTTGLFKIEKSFTDLDYALERSYDAAIICVPNHLHSIISIPVIKRRIPVLLEKPIEIIIEAAEQIRDAAKKYDTVVQVAYCFRFSTALAEIREILAGGKLGKIYCVDISVGQYLPDWRPTVDYREIYSAKRAEGGGVCIDLSHELDYFRWLFGDVAKILALSLKTSQLEIDVEDIAEAIIVTESGTIGRIHLDYLSRKLRREVHIVGENGNIEYDFVTGSLRVYHADNAFWQCKTYDADRNLIFKRQLEHFFKCIQTADTPLVDANDAIKTLELALRMRGHI